MAIVADATQIERWLRYLELLLRWNQTFNLTAIRDPEAMLTRHLLDSLAMAAFWSEAEIADMGTGAGLPGVPLAVQLSQRDYRRACLAYERFLELEPEGPGPSTGTGPGAGRFSSGPGARLAGAGARCRTGAGDPAA